MAEPEDSRGFWARVADAEYGAAPGRGVNPDVFFGGLGGWQTGAGSRFDPEKEIGYFRFDTGNEVRDAIFSIAFNELGVDNYVRAVQKLKEKNYGGAAGETFLAAASMVGGSIAFARTLNNARRAAKAIRLAQAAPTAVSRPAFVVGGGGAGTTASGSTVSTPFAQRLGAAAGSLRRPTIPKLPAGSSIADRIRRIGKVGGRRLAGALALGTPAWLYLAQKSEAAPTAEQARIDSGSATATPETPPRVIRDIVPTSDPIADAGNNARTDVAAIDRQYENILRELRKMYQLAETEEEKERLRFMLADIEAQRDAGLKAIADGYAEAVLSIRQRADTTRQLGAERSREFSQQLEGMADRTAQRMMMQDIDQQQQYRGLGSGSQNPVNEWVGLMSALAPMQQQYTQRMSDITGEGIDWMADTTSAQGLAQQADLQRLAAATRSAGIMSHQRQIGDRVQRDTEALRAAQLQVMQQQAAAQAAGQGGLVPFDRLRAIEDWASSGMGPGYVEEAFRSTGQASLTEGERNIIDIINQRYLAQQMPNAAGTPVTPGG